MKGFTDWTEAVPDDVKIYEISMIAKLHQTAADEWKTLFQLISSLIDFDQMNFRPHMVCRPFIGLKLA